MDICIDMRPALSRATGVGVYLQNIVEALGKLDSENRYHLFSSSWSERFQALPNGKNFHIYDKRWPVRVLTYSWNRLSFPTVESLLGVDLDIVHSPTPLVIPSKTARQITTVHDLYFYFHPEQVSGEMKRDYPALLREHCAKSDAIIAVSEYTKSQLVEHLGISSSKIHTVHHGADLFFAEPVSDAEADRVQKDLGITGPYFLFVGSQEPRKNLPTLLKAFAKMPTGIQLVLAGPKGQQEDLSDLISEKVIQTGYVSRCSLRALYQKALALVLPSVDEGFGLPLLEAIAAGTPIIASNIPVFHEIAADAFLSVNCETSYELRQAMHEVYSSEVLRHQLVMAGQERLKRFTWQEAARKTLDIYRHL